MKKIKRKVNNILGQSDLQAIGDLMGGLLDKQSVVLRKDLASKEDLQNLKVELKDYISQGVETVMSGMDGLSEQMAEKQEVKKLEQWALKSGYKIN
jgi:hypothetical protein